MLLDLVDTVHNIEFNAIKYYYWYSLDIAMTYMPAKLYITEMHNDLLSKVLVLF